jgi:phosphate transport system substrate-binding protein
MVQWSSAYEKTEDGCRIDYEPLGSGSGIKAIIENKVDFACSEAPLTDEQLAKARATGGEVVHVPIVLGAVVPAYNLAEASAPLRFTGPVLADIFLSRVKKWNDKAIQDLNPGAVLPDREIGVVHRSDGSGTTHIWTDYLAKVSPEWKDKVGVGTEVPWPTGKAEAGNEGVAKSVKETPGSIGYMELAYAVRRELAFGLVQNREKEFVKAGHDSVAAAVANALTDISDDLRYSLTDAPGKGSFPVCGTTWVLVHVNQPAEQGRHLVDFLYWALGDGQEEADVLFYLRLPEPLRLRAVEQLRKVQGGKSPG